MNVVEPGEPLDEPAGLPRLTPQAEGSGRDEREGLELVHQEVEVGARGRGGPLEAGELPVGAVEHVGELDHRGAADERAPAGPDRDQRRAGQKHRQRQEGDLVRRDARARERHDERRGQGPGDPPVPEDVLRLARAAVGVDDGGQHRLSTLRDS